MGLQDRDYSREHSFDKGTWGGGGGPASWLGGNARSITVTLIIINVIVFFADLVFSGNGDGNNTRSVMSDWFAVRGDTLVKPWTWYRFLTYGFVHAIEDIRHVAFNMLGLFIFGRAVENRMERAEYLRFYLAAIVIGGVVASVKAVIPALLSGDAIVAFPTVGASGAVMAITILFAFYYPDATILFMLIFPMKAWVLAVLFVVMNLFGMIGGGGPVAYEVHLAGAAWAAAYHLRRWNLRFLNASGLAGIGEFLTRRKPALRLHDPEKKLARQEAEVDRILDKIQASGIDSLTSAERKTLERHSRLKRQQKR